MIFIDTKYPLQKFETYLHMPVIQDETYRTKGGVMESMPSMNIRQLTDNQPFCAGVVIFLNNTLIITVNSDHTPSTASEPVYRIGGVGGGQEIGENIWECASREALEEIGTKVHLLNSSVTMFHDIDLHKIDPIETPDDPAPFLLARITNPTPDLPYTPGLPTGPYIYFGLFLATVEAPEELRPSDDVEALIYMPLDSWELLHEGVSAAQLVKLGIRIDSHEHFDMDRRLWLHPEESFDTVVSLMKRDPKLMNEVQACISVR